MPYGWVMEGYGDIEGYVLTPYGVPERGRRLRTLARLSPRLPSGMSAEEFMANAEALRGVNDPYNSIDLRTASTAPAIITAIGQGGKWDNASLHLALMDLAYEIGEDIQEACEAHFNGGEYHGVDEGIEPVPDSHVDLVIWGMQREMDRELRYNRVTHEQLPAVQMSEFSWPIQRAIAERRRLRYKQWGIGRKEWETGKWSLWNVQLDPEYRSRREARGLAERNDARRPE